MVRGNCGGGGGDMAEAAINGRESRRPRKAARSMLLHVAGARRSPARPPQNLAPFVFPSPLPPPLPPRHRRPPSKFVASDEPHFCYTFAFPSTARTSLSIHPLDFSAAEGSRRPPPPAAAALRRTVSRLLLHPVPRRSRRCASLPHRLPRERAGPAPACLPRRPTTEPLDQRRWGLL